VFSSPAGKGRSFAVFLDIFFRAKHFPLIPPVLSQGKHPPDWWALPSWLHSFLGGFFICPDSLEVFAFSLVTPFSPIPIYCSQFIHNFKSRSNLGTTSEYSVFEYVFFFAFFLVPNSWPTRPLLHNTFHLVPNFFSPRTFPVLL